MGKEFNALAFIYNYLHFILPQVSGLTWSHAKVIIAWIGPKNFDDARSDEELLAAALQTISRDNFDGKILDVVDTGKISFTYFLSNKQERRANLHRMILSNEDGTKEVELVYDYLPFNRVVKNVNLSGECSKDECTAVYRQYISTLKDYEIKTFLANTASSQQQQQQHRCIIFV